MKKAAIYIRVSTQEQAAEGYSIQEQTDRLTKYCEAHGWVVVKVYTDPGYSGSNLNRPAIKALIQDAQRHFFDFVLVYKLDRISRSQKDVLYLVEDVFNSNKIGFISMQENFDTTSPFGKAMIGILSVFAQLEREQIKERMQMGLDARAKEGYYHGGPYAPIGYDYKNGMLSINESEAFMVQKIYELFQTGMPTHAIYTYMAAHFPAGHKYGSWTDSSCRSVLSSVLYTGNISWKGNVYPGKHQAIIDYETWKDVQNTISQRQIREPQRKTAFAHTQILGGLVWCGKCGARYYCKQNTASRKSKIVQKYYTCYSRGKSNKNQIKDPNCKNKSWNVKVLDQIVLDQIHQLDLNRDLITPAQADSSSQKIFDLQNAIRVIEKKINRLLDLYAMETIDASALSEQIKKYDTEKQSLFQEIENAQNQRLPELSVPDANDILDTFHNTIASGNTDTLRQLIRSLIDSITIYDEKIEIHWRFS